MKYLITVLIFVIPIITKAQDYAAKKSIFISGGMGIVQSSSQEEIRSKYLPNVLFLTGFGIPITSHLYFYNRISYTSKSDFTAYEQVESINELVQATASFSQLIYNSGLRYGFFLKQDWILAFSIGLTYSLVNHQAVLNGEELQKLDNQSLYGFFGGVDLEHKFSDSNLSIYGEAQYNHIRSDDIYYRDKFSGTNLTAGVRYYFQK
jgi:hypothetical protein